MTYEDRSIEVCARDLLNPVASEPGGRCTIYTHMQSYEMRRLRTQNAEQAREINRQAQENVQLGQLDEMHEIEHIRQRHEIQRQVHENVQLRRENASLRNAMVRANETLRLTLHQVRGDQEQGGVVNALSRAYGTMVRISEALNHALEDSESEGEETLFGSEGED